MKIFWRKYKIVISIGAFLLIAPPLFYWTTLFALEKIQSKADKIQEKIIDANLDKLKIEKIPKMEEVDAEFEKNKDSVGIILDSSSKVDFIRYIESLSEETNNEIEIKVLNENQNSPLAKEKARLAAEEEARLTKKDNPGKKDISGEEKKSIEDQLLYKKYISVQIDLTGDYDGFLNFVHKLENNKYYMNILSFNLQKIFVSEEDSIKNQNYSSNGIFLSPTSEMDVGETEDDKGEPILKSSLNIIVYME
jgi:hypothetical protein